MEAKVIGYEPTSFTDQKTGEVISYTNLYVEFANGSNKAVGNRCATVRTKVDCSQLKQGDKVFLNYEVIPGTNMKPKLKAIKKVA